jgi:hypothetical protein
VNNTFLCGQVVEKWLMYLRATDTASKAPLYEPALVTAANHKRRLKVLRDKQTSQRVQEKALRGPALSVDQFRTLHTALTQALSSPLPEKPTVADAQSYAKLLATACLVEM